MYYGRYTNVIYEMLNVMYLLFLLVHFHGFKSTANTVISLLDKMLKPNPQTSKH